MEYIIIAIGIPLAIYISYWITIAGVEVHPGYIIDTEKKNGTE
jgi:hypothetical protein